MKFHKAPRPLAKNAVVEDWPRFFGPRDNCTTKERPLLQKFPETGLPKVFELTRGESYSSPIIVDGKLLHFHAIDSKETLDCHHAETGKRLWTFQYPFKYRDRYGFSNGPRSSPVVHQNRIYLIGVTAKLHCLDLKTGNMIWKRDLMEEFKIPQYFFGYGPNPMIHEKTLILNVGGKEKKTSGTCVAGLNLEDGKTVWTHEDVWGASYASPIMTKIHDRDVALVLAAGESRPAHGGLLALDPKSGKLLSRFPWRADIYESVLASTPLSINENKIFISDCYQLGGTLLEFSKDFSIKPLWKKRFFGMHMMTPQKIGNHLYGFAGRNIPDTQLKCINLKSGEILIEEDMRWKEGQRVTGLFRGSFLQTDNRTFSLGEDGSFVELKMKPEKIEIIQKTRLFFAKDSWTPPVLSNGLLYVVQNVNGFDGSSARLICYDFRGVEK
jgi:outer membrane protein assembly factor BamB